MSDVDYGLIQGSTNDEIWNEEVAKSAGARALAKAMTCTNPRCPMSTRQHLQEIYSDSGTDVSALKEAAEALAPYESETAEALRERLAGVLGMPSDAADDDDVMEGMLNVQPQPDGSLRVFQPDGTEIPFQALPPFMRQIIEQTALALRGEDDDAPPTVPKHLH